MTDYPPIATGRKVLDEIVRLLAHLRFEVERGAYVEGELATVIIDTQPNDDGATYRLLLTLFARGHRTVDWGRHMLLLRREDGPGCTWIGATDFRGQALFGSLEPGVYAVTLWLRCSSKSRAGSREPEMVAARGAGVRVYKTADGRVTATLIEGADGSVSIKFEAEDAALDGAAIRFDYASSAGVAASGELVLQKGEPERTRARSTEPQREPVKPAATWQGTVPTGEPCELMFTVEPR